MWILRGKYVELSASQRSEDWFKSRRRVTASNVEAVLGLSSFKTQAEALDSIFGMGDKSVNPDQINRMNLGTQMEEPFRQFHKSLFSQVNIYEPSLCIGLTWYDIPYKNGYLSNIYPSQLSDPLHPNWFIGGSPDGILTFPNGSQRNLELKYTQKGYPALFSEHGQFRYSPYPDRFPHIWRSHFYQMQTCMAITQNSACDYGVGSPGYYYTELVPFDRRLWVNYLYPSLVEIIETKLKPSMSNYQTEMFKAEVNSILKIPNIDELIIPV